MEAFAMTDQDFISAICTTPDDDAPRLMYADWLSERGQNERGEFIRVQCELAASGCRCDPSCGFLCKWCDEHKDRGWHLRRREREILEAHEIEWLPDFWPAFSTSAGGDWVPKWSRGFVEAITLSAAAFLGDVCARCRGQGCPICYGTGRLPGHAAALFQAMPITAVRLSDKSPWTDVPDGGYSHGWWEENAHRLNADGPNDPGNIPPALFQLMWDANPADRYADESGRWITWRDEPAIPPEELSRAAVTLGRSRVDPPLPDLRQLPAIQ